MNKKQLSVPLQTKEITWGIRYLLFHLVFLGPLLSILLSLIFPKINIDINTVYYLINFVAVIVIFRHFLKHSLLHGLSSCGKLLLIAAVGFLAYAIAIQTLQHLIYWLHPQFRNPNDKVITQTVQNNFWLSFFGTVLLVPLAEEVLFRGMIFGGLHQKSRILAYVFSILAFALVHVMGYLDTKEPLDLLFSFLQYIPAGLALAWAYEYSRSILAPLLIHTTVNAIAIISMR